MIPKRGAFALGLTAIALVLLLNFQTPSQVPVAPRTGATGGAVAGVGSAGTGGASAQAAGAKTIAGPVVNTRFGPVQVSVTVEAGQITDIAAMQLPSGDRRSAQISSRSEPTLRSEALTAQSANIDGVSGATYTSEAYARSLQAALDSAGI